MAVDLEGKTPIQSDGIQIIRCYLGRVGPVHLRCTGTTMVSTPGGLFTIVTIIYICDCDCYYYLIITVVRDVRHVRVVRKSTALITLWPQPFGVVLTHIYV